MATITLALGGDILPIRRLLPAPDTAVEVYDLVRSADLAIGNFEMPLTDRGTALHKLLAIRAPAAIAADVPALGFDIVTIANNHAVDRGWTGLVDTRDGLAAAGLTVIGAGETKAEAATPVFRSVGGVTVGVVAFSCLTPTGMGAGPDRPGISPIHVDTAYEIDPLYQMEEPGDPSVVKIRTSVRADDLAFAVETVSAARAACDVLVVTLHWGFGSGEDLAEYQMPLARALIDAGASIIHGHHPHAVHGIGFHAGAPIFCSAGTFVGQQIFLDASPAVKTLWAGMSPDGYVAMVEAGPDGIGSIRVHPTTLDDDRLPVLADETVAERIASRLARLSAPLGATATALADRSIRVRPSA